MANGARTAGVIAAMAASITLLIWAGVHNGRQRRLEMQQAQEKAASQMTLVPDSATQESTTPKLEGKPAPGFTLVDLNGKKVSLTDFKGKPVLVNFWATWCGPCKLEMPWFQEFGQKYASQGLVILGLAADDAGKTAIATTAKKSGVTYPILLADSKVEEAYGGVDYLPETFYVDRSGKVMLETAGITSEDGGKDEIEAHIKKLVASAQ
jgi:thiol-disulfide isomerase/thioredoxin